MTALQTPWAPPGQNAVVGWGPQQVATYAAVQYVDVKEYANWKITLTGNLTSLNLLNPKDGQKLLLTLVQDGTGSRLVSAWTDIFFAGGTEPTLTTTAAAVDVFELEYNAAVGKWYARAFGLDFKA